MSDFLEEMGIDIPKAHTCSCGATYLDPDDIYRCETNSHLGPFMEETLIEDLHFIDDWMRDNASGLCLEDLKEVEYYLKRIQLSIDRVK